MIENSPKSQIASLETCPGCKAEVRPGSEFCYNCGVGVKEPHKEVTTEGVSMMELKAPLENGAIKNGPGSKPMDEKVRRAPQRNMRRRSTEPVQVTWKRDEGVGLGFILLSAAAAIFVIFLLAIAYYLK